MYLEKSKTMACPTVCPAREVPPPRGNTGDVQTIGDFDHCLDIALMARHHDADRLDLIDRRIRRIQQPRISVEVNVSLDALLQLRLDLKIIPAMPTLIIAPHAKQTIRHCKL